MDLKQIGIFIAELRKKKNLTQAALGNQVGVTGKAVSKWENGQSLPDVSILNDLSEILGVTTTELLNGNYIDVNNQENIDDVTENSIKFYKEKLRKKLMKIIIALFIIILVLTSMILSIFVANNYNTCQIYTISSEDKQFKVSGMLTITNKKKVLIISEIIYLGTDIKDIYDLDYYVIQDNYVYYKSNSLDKYGYDQDESIKNINELLNKINIYLEDNTNKWDTKSFNSKQLRVEINYIDWKEKKYRVSIPLNLKREFSNSKLIY